MMMQVIAEMAIAAISVLLPCLSFWSSLMGFMASPGCDDTKDHEQADEPCKEG